MTRLILRLHLWLIERRVKRWARRHPGPVIVNIHGPIAGDPAELARRIREALGRSMS